MLQEYYLLFCKHSQTVGSFALHSLSVILSLINDKLKQHISECHVLGFSASRLKDHSKKQQQIFFGLRRGYLIILILMDYISLPFPKTISIRCRYVSTCPISKSYTIFINKHIFLKN